MSSSGTVVFEIMSSSGTVVFEILSHSSKCSTTGVTKAVVCVILSVGWCI